MVRPGWTSHHDITAMSLVMSLRANDDLSTFLFYLCFDNAFFPFFFLPSAIYLHGVRPLKWQAQLTRWFIISSLCNFNSADCFLASACVSVRLTLLWHITFPGLSFFIQIMDTLLESGLNQWGEEKLDHFYEPRGRVIHKIHVKLELALHCKEDTN